MQIHKARDHQQDVARHCSQDLIVEVQCHRCATRGHAQGTTRKLREINRRLVSRQFERIAAHVHGNLNIPDLGRQEIDPHQSCQIRRRTQGKEVAETQQTFFPHDRHTHIDICYRHSHGIRVWRVVYVYITIPIAVTEVWPHTYKSIYTRRTDRHHFHFSIIPIVGGHVQIAIFLKC